MDYRIIYWENEEMREIGESSMHTSHPDKSEAIAEAKKLYFHQDFPAVEVEDENGGCIFHISTEVPEGEAY